MWAVIKVSKSALFEMIMAAFEAYAVKHDGKDMVAIEVHAQVWGKINKAHPFKCSIEHVSVDTSAIQERGSVEPNPLTLEIKKDIASVFGMGYEHIGTFHSHPYLKHIEVANTNEIRKNKFYNFSKGDHECEFDEPTMKVGNKNYSVALVMTIHAAEKSDDRKDGPIDINLFEFSLGNVKLWLKAQVYQHIDTDNLTHEDKLAFNMYGLDIDDHIEIESTLPIPVETQLDCEFLECYDFILEGFGRLDISSKFSKYRNKEISEKRLLHSE